MSSSLSPHGAFGSVRGERDPCIHDMGQKNLTDNGYRHRLLQSPRPKNTSCKSITGSGIYFYSETFDGTFKLFTTTEPLSVSKIKDGIFCLSCNSFQDLPRQCRGLVFMRKVSRDGWCLCILRKLDIATGKAQYINWSTSHPYLSHVEISEGCMFSWIQARSVFIVTSGLSLSKKTSGNLKPIGFANFPHKDKRDYIWSDATHLFQYQFDKVLGSSKYSANLGRLASDYVSKVACLTGHWGIPTTCAHLTYHGDSNCSVKGLHSKFAMMDFAMPIDNKKIHHFYGWAFQHCTIVPYYQYGHNVRFLNGGSDDDVLVFVWGQTGGTPETRTFIPNPHHPRRHHRRQQN